MKKMKFFKSALTTFALLTLVIVEIFCFTLSSSLYQHSNASASIFEISKSENNETVDKARNNLSNAIPELQPIESIKTSGDPFPNVTIDPIPDQIYNGEAPNPKIVVRDGDKILVEDDYYTIIALSHFYENAHYYKYLVSVNGLHDYSGLYRFTYFYVIIPEPQFIHLELDVPKDKEFSTDEEWSAFAESNLKLTFGLKHQNITLTNWVIDKSYIDVKNAFRRNDGTIYGAYGVVEIYVRSTGVTDEFEGGGYIIVNKYSLNYTGSLEMSDFYWYDEKNRSFTIILACSILGAVVVAAAGYYIISFIKKKKTKKD